jgi:hypothetical protein
MASGFGVVPFRRDQASRHLRDFRSAAGAKHRAGVHACLCRSWRWPIWGRRDNSPGRASLGGRRPVRSELEPSDMCLTTGTLGQDTQGLPSQLCQGPAGRPGSQRVGGSPNPLCSHTRAGASYKDTRSILSAWTVAHSSRAPRVRAVSCMNWRRDVGP